MKAHHTPQHLRRDGIVSIRHLRLWLRSEIREALTARNMDDALYEIIDIVGLVEIAVRTLQPEATRLRFLRRIEEAVERHHHKNVIQRGRTLTCDQAKTFFLSLTRL